MFYFITLVALPLAGIAALQRVFYRSPQQQAIISVNNRDGWTREDLDGYVIADLNGGTCPIRDRSLQDLLHCKKLKRLTAYGTGITDEGLRHLVVHEHLAVLHLDDCIKITDAAIPYLSQLDQLDELSVTGTSISEVGLQSLRCSMPKCSINPRPHGRLAGSAR